MEELRIYSHSRKAKRLRRRSRDEEDLRTRKDGNGGETPAMKPPPT
jgi:hypothetical protein